MDVGLYIFNICMYHQGTSADVCVSWVFWCAYMLAVFSFDLSMYAWCYCCPDSWKLPQQSGNWKCLKDAGVPGRGECRRSMKENFANLLRLLFTTDKKIRRRRSRVSETKSQRKAIKLCERETRTGLGLTVLGVRSIKALIDTHTSA